MVGDEGGEVGVTERRSRHLLGSKKDGTPESGSTGVGSGPTEGD